jgi:hypothetical protein
MRMVFERMVFVAEWYEGSEMQLFNLMVSHLGLDWRIIDTDFYGEIQENGSFTYGSLKWNLQTGRADLAFCELWLIPAVYVSVDALTPRQTCCARYSIPYFTTPLLL